MSSHLEEPTLNVLEACHRLALIEGQKENENRGIKMRKTLSNIVALAVLIAILLFCGLLYFVMAFSLVAFFKVNGWLAVAISCVASGSLAVMCGCLAKKIGVKLEL